MPLPAWSFSAAAKLTGQAFKITPKTLPFHRPGPPWASPQSRCTASLADGISTQPGSFLRASVRRPEHLGLVRGEQSSGYQGLPKAFNRKHLCQIERTRLVFCLSCKLSAPRIHPASLLGPAPRHGRPGWLLGADRFSAAASNRQPGGQ